MNKNNNRLKKFIERTNWGLLDVLHVGALKIYKKDIGANNLKGVALVQYVKNANFWNLDVKFANNEHQFFFFDIFITSL